MNLVGDIDIWFWISVWPIVMVIVMAILAILAVVTSWLSDQEKLSGHEKRHKGGPSDRSPHVKE